MASPHPFSVRLDPGLDARITAMAKRLRRSKASVLQSLADEAERMRRHPYIWFMGPPDERRAAVAGTRWKLFLLIPTLQHYAGDYAGFSEDFGTSLNEDECRAALAYYEEFRAEIDAEIADQVRPVEEWQRDFPGGTFVAVEG
jgi:hypothetical protein